MKLKYERPIITKVTAGIPDKYGMQSRVQSITKIDNIQISELISKYGSPLFVISEHVIKERYQEAKRAFSTRYPKVQFAWSYKTNYLDAVCRIYHREGSWAEVVSGFEYEKALNNGVPGHQIVFNGPEKSKEMLRLAVKNGSLIHLDHFDELYMLCEVAEELTERPKVAIRVNMDTGIYPMWDRFGFNYENGEAWNALTRIMVNPKLDLVGLHTHIGTYIMSTDAYGIAASKLAELAVRLDRKYNHHIKYIDLGGGFATKNTLKGAYLPGSDTCPSFDEYADAITSALISSELDPQYMPVLMLETGRALIDDAGFLVGTVLANKRLSSGRRATIIDAGVNMLFTSFWYEHSIAPAQPTTGHTEDTTIYGPLCMNIDVIRESIRFPLLKKGDHFIISRIGAYNMTQWMQFITYRPAIVLITEDGKTHIIREGEDAKAFRNYERVPE